MAVSLLFAVPHCSESFYLALDQSAHPPCCPPVPLAIWSFTLFSLLSSTSGDARPQGQAILGNELFHCVPFVIRAWPHTGRTEALQATAKHADKRLDLLAGFVFFCALERVTCLSGLKKQKHHNCCTKSKQALYRSLSV